MPIAMTGLQKLLKKKSLFNEENWADQIDGSWGLKVLVMQVWWPAFDLWNFYKDGRREAAPHSCLLTSVHTQWHTCPAYTLCMHSNGDDDDDDE